MNDATLSQRRGRIWRLGLFLYLFATIAYFMPGSSWHPVSRYSLTRAIVEHGTFEITRYAESTGDRARVGDKFFTDKAPLPSFLAVPAYALFHQVAALRGRFPAFKAEGTAEKPAQRVSVSPAFRKGLYVTTLSTSCAATALLGLVLFDVLRRRLEQRAALLGALSTVIGTPLFPYGASFFGHSIAASALLCAFALMDPLGPPQSRGRRVLSGVLLGLAAGSEYIVLVPAVFLGSYFVWGARRSDRLETALLCCGGALLPLSVVAAYHTACFGAPWTTGYSFIVHPSFAPGHAQGFLGITYPRLTSLYGILFGSSRGLFYLSPICAAGIGAGIVAWRRTRGPGLAAAALVFLTLTVINASYYRWDGGWATGPRHLVPALGLVGVAIGYAFQVASLRTLAAVLAGYSCVVMVLTTAVGLEAPPDTDAIFDYLIPSVKQGTIARVSGASNLGIELGLSRKASILPVLLWLALGGPALLVYSSRGARNAPRGYSP